MSEYEALLRFVDRHASILEPTFAVVLKDVEEKESGACSFNESKQRDEFALALLICMVFNSDGHAPLSRVLHRHVFEAVQAARCAMDANLVAKELAALIHEQQGHNLSEPLLMAVVGLLTGSVSADDLVSATLVEGEEEQTKADKVHNPALPRVAAVKVDLFPSYFAELHVCLTQLVECQSWSVRLERTKAMANWLLGLPDDAVMMALPHVTLLWACGSRGGGGGAKEITGFPTPDIHLGALELFGFVGFKTELTHAVC